MQGGSTSNGAVGLRRLDARTEALRCPGDEASVNVSRSVAARRHEIALAVELTKTVNVEELAAKYSVTASTIRRDLALLARDGVVARTYGGAIAAITHHESPYRQRTVEASEAKRGIARWAAVQVLPGESILLDAGTTVGALAHELRSVGDLTIAAVGMTVLEELADVESVHVECLGGTLRHISHSFVGPLAEAALERMDFDRAFLGADGVRADRGICEAALEQTRLKELMARRADHVYVLTHAAKVGRGDFHAWAQLPKGWTLVTDDGVQQRALAPFRDLGIKVVVVDRRGHETGG